MIEFEKIAEIVAREAGEELTDDVYHEVIRILKYWEDLGIPYDDNVIFRIYTVVKRRMEMAQW